MAHLVFYRRGQELMRVALDGSRLSLGRGSDADVVIPDSTISRAQAAIEWDGNVHRIRDLSGRGVSINGGSVSEAVLEDGTDIAFGQFRAVYVVGLPGDGGVETRTLVRTDSGEPVQQDLPKDLTLIVTPPKGQTFNRPLQTDLEIGQSPQAGLRLEHPIVSTRHCRLQRDAKRLLLSDLGSTNGTFLGGVRIYEVELPIGAHFKVGPFDLRVVNAGAAPVTAARDFEGIVSSDPAMLALFTQIERVAASTAPVAIFGETGTGKELVARAVHRRSQRAASSLIPLNCSAVAREIMESELFGHEKGAFTGAASSQEGALGAANGGTLFLDEIGELPLELQAKLLRAVELGEIKRVGASKPTLVDVRFVCATHRDLASEVRHSRFREDLYYRLAVANLFVPPLRQRKGDLPQLWEHFLLKLSPPGTRLALSDAAHAKLVGHPWPGNVRELRNVLQRALLSSSGSRIEEGDIHFDDRPSDAAKHGGDLIDPRGQTLEQIERQAIEIVMRQRQGNRRQAAKVLDIAKSTLLKKLADYGLEGVGLGQGQGAADEE